ncbi:ABC transporter permease [Bifidobacterium imperatoris]|uniref:ABC transporter permease n=1 Tax=Bifidobacterium imperatoris TaxID=2020965 RepID=A0A2N5IV59_9BIFI|nr:ABC transporter permease [Bifidobacterium imperatoris]PLS25817.1 ABC transporter permease [Bifidobacterium imperatoris]QSY57885.1 ABC transporter permease [Bifidobacterium imperatoris]
MKKTALWKDAWRAIAGNGKRFAAMLVIVAVGVMMLGGLNAIARDIRGGLDEFFDTTAMHDVSIISTLGFDDDDIDALQQVDGIAKVAGEHSASVTTAIDGKQSSATITTLNNQGVEQPYLKDGRLPKSTHEIAVTEQYLRDSGKSLGDTLTFKPDDSGAAGRATGDSEGMFETDKYTIVGTVIDPNDIVNPSGPLALVSGAKTVYPMFVSEDSLNDTDAPYTSVVITVAGAKTLNTYDDDYLNAVDDAVANIEAIQTAREQARTDAMPKAKWIIRDRSAVTSYEDVKTQTEMIARLGTMFPVLFLIIALLVSLTAITRMVEEERGLIGTYKALGYTRHEIMLKYLVYSGAACLFGGLLGDVLGLIGLPFMFTRKIITDIYVLPNYPLLVDWRLALGGVLLFVVIITGAAMVACAGSLRLEPAELMRPKAPKAGKTIFLQRIGFVWNHLSFLGKVTARNLFRYKSRALMVIIGVLGCTALMTAGFGMGSSALTLMPRQHSEIAPYDVLAVTSAANHDKAQSALDDDSEVKSTLPLQLGSVTLAPAQQSGSDTADDAKITAQLMVIPDGKSTDGYINLQTSNGSPIELEYADDAIIVTANAARKLALASGSTVNLTDQMANTADATVHEVAQYYTGNLVVMSQSAYKQMFDADYVPNADLINVRGDADVQIAFADDLAEQSEYLSVTSSAKQERDFSKSFQLFFVMIGFIVIMAAILAVVVLYTLASTNISERERELATIKVLGFRKREVHGYVNKEMLLLSVIGIAIGMPCGRGLLGFLVSQLDLPGMNIVPNVPWFCYAGAAALALAFTLLVSLATNRSLDRIDMVGALKSPE